MDVCISKSEVLSSNSAQVRRYAVPPPSALKALYLLTGTGFCTYLSSAFFLSCLLMAVPKKRLSKSKTKLRKTKWKEKAMEQAKKAFSLALSLLKRSSERL